MTIEKPRFFNTGFSEPRIVEKWISRKFSQLGIKGNLDNAKTVADLGCGIGATTVALRRLSPHAELHSIDSMHKKVGKNYLSEVFETSYRHFYMNFHDYFKYLIENGISLDIALIFHVPDHQLSKEYGYLLLSKVIKEGGIVLEHLDTNLDPIIISRDFDLVYNDPTMPFAPTRIWNKT